MHYETFMQGRIQEKMWPVSKRVSAEGASRLGGSGGMLPRKILNIWLSKTLFPAFSGLKFDNIMYLSSDLHKCKCKCRQTFTRVNSRSVFQGFAPRPESGNYQIPKFWPVSVNRCKPVWIRACFMWDLHDNRSYFPEERKCIVFALQHSGNHATWKCSGKFLKCS